MTASNVDAEEQHTWTTRCDTTGDIKGVLHKWQENGEMARMPLMIIINDKNDSYHSNDKNDEKQYQLCCANCLPVYK